jgi:hypothetical protein
MDADKAAVGAVVARSLGLKGMLTRIPAEVLPRLRTGLRLRRCKKYYTNDSDRVAFLQSAGYSSVPTEEEAYEIIETRFGIDRSLLTQIQPPTDTYNCHGYTFTDGDVWINDDQVQNILDDNGYSVTTDPVVGDIVIYTESGGITHSGVITEVSGNVVKKVVSKWGATGLYEHAPDDAPNIYGAWEVYHTDRDNGNLLRTEPSNQ